MQILERLTCSPYSIIRPIFFKFKPGLPSSLTLKHDENWMLRNVKLNKIHFLTSGAYGSHILLNRNENCSTGKILEIFFQSEDASNSGVSEIIFRLFGNAGVQCCAVRNKLKTVRPTWNEWLKCLNGDLSVNSGFGLQWWFFLHIYFE